MILRFSEALSGARLATYSTIVDALCHAVSIKLSVNSADGRLSGTRSVDEGRVAQRQSGNQLLVKRFIQGAEALIGQFNIQCIEHTVSSVA